MARRQEVAEQLWERLDTKQREFFSDPHDHKVWLCGRRRGKTYALAADLFRTCLLKPKARCAYIALSRESARQIIWDQFYDFNEDFGLQIVFKETTLEAHFPNGSKITLFGCDQDIKTKRLRGQKFHKVVVDECGEFPSSVLKRLVEDILDACLMDYKDSALVLAGTPGYILAGYWYSISRKDQKEIRRHVFHTRPYAEKDAAAWEGAKWKWSVHYGTALDNERLPIVWEKIQRKKEEEGWSNDNPTYRREYLAEWVEDASCLFYPYREDRNYFEPAYEPTNKLDDEAEELRKRLGLPQGHQWMTSIAIDLGGGGETSDPTAMTVAAYSDTCENIYFLYSEKRPEAVSYDLVVGWYYEIDADYGPFNELIVDYGNSGLAGNTLSEEYGLPIIAAPKGRKKENIQLMASEMHEGRIKIDTSQSAKTQDLIAEWQTLKPAGNGHAHSERDDAADSALYLFNTIYPLVSHKAKRRAETKQDAVRAWKDERRSQLLTHSAQKKMLQELDGYTNPVNDDYFFSN